MDFIDSCVLIIFCHKEFPKVEGRDFVILIKIERFYNYDKTSREDKQIILGIYISNVYEAN